MLTKSNSFSRKPGLVILSMLMTCAMSPAYTQGSFVSGSTGADGAFNPTASQTIQIPAGGVFNYTTVNIPSGVTITYARNTANTPVTILATGNVAINGTISVDGANAASNLIGGKGGPGAFDGGRGATGASNDTNGLNGGGPGGGGGGQYNNGFQGGGGGGGGFGGMGLIGFPGSGVQAGTGGTAYGSQTLIPLIGGSGGGGSAAGPSPGNYGNSGGGGGGSILIASTGTISGSGSINARGGNSGNFSACYPRCGGGGSGGGIRMVANTISGSPNLNVSGGVSGFGNGDGGGGYVRIEGYNLASFNPTISAINGIATTSTPISAVPSNLPSLSITSVAGIAVPANPSGSFNSPPDITVPTAQANPVTVALAATNIPTGTLAQVKVTPESGAPTTVQSTPLAGTQASSTATASVTLPAGICVITAATTIDLTLVRNLPPIFIDGERVRKMEIAATFGGQSEITYITESGKRIKRTGE
ncbi:MAG: hypothetical protein ACKVX9_12555 [Blastocatellia bacterium]